MASEWQPIETAPWQPNADEGGLSPRIILGFAPDETNYAPHSREGYWNAELQCWVSTLDPGWKGPQPTHWLPLPDPPSDRS